MRSAMLPFNIEITNPQRIPWAMMRPVTSLDIYDGLSTDLNDNGLYSIPIFGRVGSEERDERFSYIHIKSSVFHPEIFKSLTALKQMYAGILSGNTYAVWDENEKDFIKSSALEGQTGYSFFTEHWAKIEFKETGSPKRSDKIKLIAKYKALALHRNIPVLPAGLREIQVDERGRTVENEVNDMYRKLLSAANTVVDDPALANSSLYDSARWTLQNRFNELYEHYAGMLSGKRGLLQQKWGSRRVFNGTRNVLTAAQLGTSSLGSRTAPDMNNTRIGLYQLARGALPLTIHMLQTGWLSQVFANGTLATLVDRKTLKRTDVEIDTMTLAKWTMQEGLEKLINGFREPRLRNKPITVNGNYLGLVYSDDFTFKVFGDIDELPANFSRKHVHPLTYTELLYLSGYQRWNDLYMLVVRYPITGMGSVYQTKAYVCTTMKSTVKQALDESWDPIEGVYALEFPTNEREAEFMESIAAHASRLGLMGGDWRLKESAPPLAIASMVPQARKSC